MAPFTDFLFHLRGRGLRVSLTEWLSLLDAVADNHAQCDLERFYHLARALLVKSETQYDLYDQCFAEFFEGVERQFAVDEELLAWLDNPILPRELSAEDRATLAALGLEELREKFLERLREQSERHDGGSKWIGTGGTSPFGHGGTHPTGVRVGGSGGGRSAVQVASERRFRNLRSDRVIDTREIGMALRRLRRLGRDEGPEELDLERTVDRSARQGEIELVFAPPRKNRLKLLLMVDVGGSMDPHALLSERLFSAAHAANHFKAFEWRLFHNCVYEHLYTDIARRRGEPTADVLRRIDPTWTVIVVGDAWMSPYELLHSGGAIDFYQQNATPGLAWLQRIRERCPSSVWLNPEPRAIWDAPSVRLVRSVFPMYELTLDGLSEAVDVLCGRRAASPPASATAPRSAANVH